MSTPLITAIEPANATLAPGQSRDFIVLTDAKASSETFSVIVVAPDGRRSQPVKLPLVFTDPLTIEVEKPTGSRAVVKVAEQTMSFTVTNPA